MEDKKQMQSINDIYIYPAVAKHKMKIAQQVHHIVYIYGIVGCGKTALVKHYLGHRKYCYLDAATDTADKFNIPFNSSSIVVVDNLQWADTEEIRKDIIKLTERKDIWLILAGRCKCPSWLVPASVMQYPFMIINEEDIRLSLGEIKKYLEAYCIYIDEEEAGRLMKDSQGHAMVLKMVVIQMLQGGKDLKKKSYVYNDDIFEKSQKMLCDYVDRQVYDQWEPELTEFIQQICIVDSFDVRMAEAISGSRNVEALLKKALDVGNFLQEQNGEYIMITPVLRSMRKRIKIKYTRPERNRLYYNAGRCYAQEGKIIEALFMFEACGDKQQISSILIENARINPGSGYLFELRKYYLELPESYIEESVELISGMCMLQSLLLNPEESERWYEVLKQKKKSGSGRKQMIIKSWIAYLDIALPHRGSIDIISMMKNVWVLLKNREIILPEFSVTSNAPSMMSGGKDFCEWSRKDSELAASIGNIISFVLGKYGAGLVELALAESFFEKGKDNYEVVRLVSKGQMHAENRGKLEQEFVAAGLLSNIHILTGHAEDARVILNEFKKKAKADKAEKLLPNILNLLCRISLYQGEKAEIDQWMNTAPGDMEDFNPFERYRYLTKIRVFLLYGKYEMAESLLEKMFYYAEVMQRTFVHMECELLLSIMQYRRGEREWVKNFKKVLDRLEDYHFVRLISREGCAVLPLLKYKDWNMKDKAFMARVMAETENMAEYYPSYLKEQNSGDDFFSENAICILRLQAEGMSNEQIAEKMKLSVATVKYHCSQNYKKLNVTGKAAAVMEAKRRKLI